MSKRKFLLCAYAVECSGVNSLYLNLIFVCSYAVAAELLRRLYAAPSQNGSTGFPPYIFGVHDAFL